MTGLEALGIGKRGPVWPIIGGSVDTPPVPNSGDPGKTGEDFAPITSQEVLNHIIAERLGRERAKYVDYDDVKKKADAFDALEAEKLSEVEKANQRAQAAELERDRLAVETLRLTVSAEKGIPAALLTGNTREELEKSADTLVSWRGQTPASPDKGVKPNPQQGTPPGNKPSARALGEAEAAKRFSK
ncbi:hypothetical protein AB0G00_24075 [Nocardia salmonicida]|uniref:hypothetical protein n=1 Tax=Nocardia salmonicida TaxID=53431 RepID=UPI0033CA3825